MGRSARTPHGAAKNGEMHQAIDPRALDSVGPYPRGTYSDPLWDLHIEILKSCLKERRPGQGRCRMGFGDLVLSHLSIYLAHFLSNVVLFPIFVRRGGNQKSVDADPSLV